MNTNAWQASSGRVIGRGHAVFRRNGQDGCATWALGSSAIGVVSDGCGEGARSEVGAALTVAIALGEMRACVEGGEPLAGLPVRVLGAVVAALGAVASRVLPGATRQTFVREHLLATIVGFAVRGEDAVVFAQGDGFAWIDGELVDFDENNTPTYPAYALGGAELAPRVVARHGVRRVAVATDGFDDGSLALAAELRAGRDLTRHLTRLQREGAFEDDAAFALAARDAGGAP